MDILTILIIIGCAVMLVLAVAWQTYHKSEKTGKAVVAVKKKTKKKKKNA